MIPTRGAGRTAGVEIEARTGRSRLGRIAHAALTRDVDDQEFRTPTVEMKDRELAPPKFELGGGEEFPRWPIRGPASTLTGMTTPELRGEKRWPMAITLAVAVALTVLLPLRYSWGPPWIFPVIEGLLLVSVIIADPGRIDRRTRGIRILNVGLVFILVAKSAGITVRLIVDLIRGGPETNSAALLLRWDSSSGYSSSSVLLLVLGLRQRDPEARSQRAPPFPTRLFPKN